MTLVPPFVSLSTLPSVRHGASRPYGCSLEHEAEYAVLMPRVSSCGDVSNCISAAREWFETHEPRSPVAILLRQTGRMVGRRFSKIAYSISFNSLRSGDVPREAP